MIERQPVRVTCSVAIPANSVAQIAPTNGYNATSQVWTVQKPNAANLPISTLIYIPEAIPAGGVGEGVLDWTVTVLKCDKVTKVGKILGSKSGSFQATEGGANLEVVSLLGDGSLAVCRMRPSGGGRYATIRTHTTGAGTATVRFGAETEDTTVSIFCSSSQNCTNYPVIVLACDYIFAGLLAVPVHPLQPLLEALN